MTETYYRPLVQSGPDRPPGAVTLAGGWTWFDQVEARRRDGKSDWITPSEMPQDAQERLAAPRPAVAGLALDRPRIMGILNVTPDSFSDGGEFAAAETAIAHGRAMAAAGIDIVDVGGESTRPGSDPVPAKDELARILPVVRGLKDGPPISVDTRKAQVAQAALDAGAAIVNDVSAMTFDPDMAATVAATDAPICLMHAAGDPKTMQDDPRYDDVVLDVYDALAARIAAAETAGIPRDRIIVDPGIGFGKTVDHNLALIRDIAIFHGLGCPVLLGASRKRFIGAIAGQPKAGKRLPGSLAVALAGIAQGVQITRVHDIAETMQAVAIWRAINTTGLGG